MMTESLLLGIHLVTMLWVIDERLKEIIKLLKQKGRE
jgi:hypothetical protein